jgi:hypothetical protein
LGKRHGPVLLAATECPHPAVTTQGCSTLSTVD